MSSYIKQSPKEQLSQLFRAVEDEKGATGLADFVMDTFETLLDAIEPKDVEDLYNQFYELFRTVKSTEPRISLVIFNFFTIWEELQKEKSNVKTIEDFKKIVLSVARKIQVQNEEEFQAIVKAGADSVQENDVILVHSHSCTVREALAKAVSQGKKFRTIIAEQEFDKTAQLVEFFASHDISFSVVPEYMLSHMTDEVTKVFFGATTLDSEQRFVCDAGSYAVLAEFHAEHIPNFMFLTTKKFSLWKASSKHETFKTLQQKVYESAKCNISYERVKYSHDRVPAELFDSIVTEIGNMKPAEAKELYQKRYSEREKMRKEFFSDDGEK